jgi:Aminopeptidase P, N-terminal domain
VSSVATGAAAAVEADVRTQLERRRREVVERWQLTDEVVLFGAGSRIHVPGRADRTYPFRSHSEYLYLTDRERPEGVLAFDPADGWTDFVAPVTREERLWEGAPEDAPDGRPVAELDGWLEARTRRRVAASAPRWRRPHASPSDPALEATSRAA